MDTMYNNFQSKHSTTWCTWRVQFRFHFIINLIIEKRKIFTRFLKWVVEILEKVIENFHF